MNFGSLEGINIRDEKVLRFLKEPILDYRFPNGESIAEVMGRTQDFSDFESNPVFFITNFYCQLYCQCSIISELVINIIGVYR